MKINACSANRWRFYQTPTTVAVRNTCILNACMIFRCPTCFAPKKKKLPNPMQKHLIIAGDAQSPFLRSQWELPNIFYRINNQILASFWALIIISLVHWLLYLFFYNKIFHADLWRLTSHLTAWEVAVSIANETGWRNIMNIMIDINAFWLEVKLKFNINKSTFCHSFILSRVLNSKQTKYILLFFYSKQSFQKNMNE